MASFGNSVKDVEIALGVSGVYVSRFVAPDYGNTLFFRTYFKWAAKPFHVIPVVYADNQGVRGKLLAKGNFVEQIEDGDIDLPITFFVEQGKPYHFGYCIEKSVFTRGTTGTQGQTARDGKDNYPNPPEDFGVPTQLYNQQLYLIIEYESAAPPALDIKISPNTATVFLGDTQTFEALVSGGRSPFAIEWFLADGSGLFNSVGTGLTFDFKAQTEGNYQIYAFVTDSENMTAQSLNVDVEVIPKPPRPDVVYTHGVKRTSEIRAMFLNALNMSNPDMEQIAETCSSYGINTLVIETGSNCSRYPSKIVKRCAGLTRDYVQEAIEACHPRGIKVYVSMNVMMGVYLADGKEKRAMTATGLTNWLCPTRPFSREHVVALVKELFRDHPNLDGFMFDYLRYEGDMCYCDFCKEKFIADTGLTDVNWFADVHGEGSKYHKEFIEWRIKPINELLSLMRNAILEVKPTCEFTAAVWRWITGHPQYWRYWLGQDATFWVSQGWLDWICPMIYVDNPDTLETSLMELREYLAGGEDGLIPVVPFIDLFVDAVSTPENFAERVERLRSINADGFIVWSYGGAGDGWSYPSITDYFDLTENIPIFEIYNISWKKQGDFLTVTWNTNYPASSKIEYSPQLMFETVKLHNDAVNFDYYKINHVEGSIIEEDAKTKDHAITFPLAGEENVYFRISSIGSLTATTEQFYSADLPPTEPAPPEPPSEGGIRFLLPFFAIFVVLVLAFLMTGKGGE